MMEKNLKKNIYIYTYASLVAQVIKIKNSSAMQETWVRFLGWELPPKKEMITYSNILRNIRNLMDRGAWWAPVHGVTKSQTGLSD